MSSRKCCNCPNVTSDLIDTIADIIMRAGMVVIIIHFAFKYW